MNSQMQSLIKQHGGILYDEDGDETGISLVGEDLENFAHSVVDRCCELIEEASTSRCVHTTYDSNLAECVKLELVKFVKNYFQR